ncbi:hypothetical protein RDABS01_037057 [Bienertia sinuspersici]
MRELKACKNEMALLMEEAQTKEVIAKMKSHDDRMDELENREELYWRQRSRQDWLKNGDKNTAFFHAKAKQRVARNNITIIRDEAGNIYDEEDQITEMLATHFETLFTSGGDVEPTHIEQTRKESNLQLVRELWQDREWDKERLEELFNEGEVEKIIKIPIPLFDDQDKWTWHYSKDGRFTVRSAYNMLVQDHLRAKAYSSNSKGKFDWKALWNINLPQKIKVFAWRAVKNGIAVKALMYARGLSNDGVCPMCGEEEETIIHLLANCQEVRRLWYLSPLRLKVEEFPSNTLKDWVKTLKHVYKEARWWDIFWSMCWGIWLRRNMWLFEKKKKREDEVLHKAMGIVGEYELASRMHGDRCAKMNLNAVWKPPKMGTLKINTDAASFSNGIGLGGVTRDSTGEVVVATCMFLEGSYEVEMAEAMAMRHALRINIEAGFTNFVLEMDNMKLFSHLAKGTEEPTHFGGVTADIRHLATLCQDISFSFIRREGNRVAHGLAKLSCNFNEYRVWLEDVPSDLVELVVADAKASSS